jgi:hypothetical protein
LEEHAIDYAQNCACFRSGEIHVLDSSGNVERTISFSEADRKLRHRNSLYGLLTTCGKGLHFSTSEHIEDGGLVFHYQRKTDNEFAG